MFDPEKIYNQTRIGKIAGRTSRTVRNWKDRGLLPEPDVLVGGKDPGWWGKTLNDSPAFAKPDSADAA